MTMLHQIENINKDIEIIFKKRVKIPQLKSTEMKTNSLEELNSRLELSEQRIIEFKDRSIERMQAKEQREKRKKWKWREHFPTYFMRTVLFSY